MIDGIFASEVVKVDKGWREGSRYVDLIRELKFFALRSEDWVCRTARTYRKWLKEAER